MNAIQKYDKANDRLVWVDEVDNVVGHTQFENLFERVCADVKKLPVHDQRERRMS